MDAPEETNRLGTPISKFEDSPVFSYISELSPIKPVRPVHHTQTSSSLSFRSPASVFTSPQVKFLKMNNLSSEYGKQICSSEVVHSYTNHAYHNSGEQQENSDQGTSMGGSLAEQLSQCRKCTLGPFCDPTPCCDEKISLLGLPGNVVSDNEACDVFIQGLFSQQQEIQRPRCDSERLITDSTDLLIFNSPNETEALKGIMQEPTIQPSNFLPQLPQIDQMQHNLSNFAVMASNPHNEKMDNEHISITHRRMLRRSLDFEMAGMQMKTSYDGSSTSSCTLQCYKRNIPNEKCLVPAAGNINSQGCILPGTDSHLNSLATLKDYRIMTNRGLPYIRQLSQSNSTSSLHLSASQQCHQISSMITIAGRDLDSQDIWTHLAKDCSLPSSHIIGEGFNQKNPQRRRRKSEPVGVVEGCKHCKCKKSKCLKLYCECFAAGVYCMGPCSCQDCSNKLIYKHIVLTARRQIESRDPLAFAPKVIKSDNPLPEIGDDPNKIPPSTRHRRGCNCKKSGCLKKYCECYQSGVGCTISCRCQACKNTYGRKDGMETETRRKQARNSRNPIFFRVLENFQSNPALQIPKVLQGDTNFSECLSGEDEQYE